MGSFNKILEKYRLEKWFRRDNLIVLVLAGILLIVITLPTNDTIAVQKSEEPEQTEVKEAAGSENAEGVDYLDIYEYTAYLEKKLEQMLVKIDGAGNVSVMITLEASAKQIVEKEETLSRNNTLESDSEGGNRSIYEIDTGQQTVYYKSDNVQTPYVSQTILPEISGVLIVAQGAGATSVKKSMVEIAQALFGIEAHKISVVSMREN